MKRLLALATVCAASQVHGSDNCVLQDITVKQTQVVIQERSNIKRTIMTMPSGQLKCMVSFRVLVSNNWHTAHGSYQWNGQQPVSEACAVAVASAEDQVRQSLGRSQTSNEKILVCSDDKDLQLLKNSQIGTVGTVSQFRPHPEYPNRFYHRGTQCRWFIESEFNKNRLTQFQGIVCEVQNDKWIVIDKF